MDGLAGGVGAIARLVHGRQFSAGGRRRISGGGVRLRGGTGGIPRPQLPAGPYLHGRQRLAIHGPGARRPRALARARAVPEPFCGRHRSCHRTRRPDPRHDFRDRHAPPGGPTGFEGRDRPYLTRSRRARDFRGARRLARVGTRGRWRADRPGRSFREPAGSVRFGRFPAGPPDPPRTVSVVVQDERPSSGRREPTRGGTTRKGPPRGGPTRGTAHTYSIAC